MSSTQRLGRRVSGGLADLLGNFTKHLHLKEIGAPLVFFIKEEKKRQSTDQGQYGEEFLPRCIQLEKVAQ